MARTIDLKSFVIGGALVLSVVYVLGASPRPASPGPVGRFAIGASGAGSSDAFILDTVTGQVWSRYGRGGTGSFYGPKLKPQTPEEPNEPRL